MTARVAVLGGGSWGTTVAQVVASTGRAGRGDVDARVSEAVTA